MKNHRFRVLNGYRPAGILLAMIILGFAWSAQALTLEACIKTALENNPDIQAGLSRMQAADHMIKQAESAYYPRLYLSGTYSLTNNPTQAFMMALNQRDLDMTDPAFDPNDPDLTDNLRLSMGLKYRIYNGGVNTINVQLAEAGKQFRELSLRAVQNALVHQVTRGYYAVLRARSFVHVQKESVASLKESLRVAQVRHEAGSAVKTDVLNLDVKLAQAREDLIRAENGVQLAVASLNTALGSQRVSMQNLPSPAEERLREMPAALDFDGIENRPEIKVNRTLSRIKAHAYKKATREYRPSVNAFGSYDLDSGGFEGLEDSYLVGVMAEWEFFDGSQRSNAIRAAEADWQAAQKEALKVRNDLRLDIHRAYLEAGEAWERLEVSEKSSQSAAEALRITAELYKEGVADITALLTAQVGLTAQKTRRVAAYYDYLTALSNYDRAMGLAAVTYIKE